MEETTKTTIQIDNKTWELLNKLKGRGESFDEVILKLIRNEDIVSLMMSGNIKENMQRKPITDAEMGKICLYLKNKGLSDKKLSKELGISIKKINSAIDIFNKEKLKEGGI